MQLKVLALGKLKDPALSALVSEYVKRLRPYTPTEVVELKDERAPESLSEKEAQGVLEREGEALLAKINPRDTVIVLAVEGKQVDSPAFSEKLYDFIETTAGDVVFVIGSSMGLSPAVKARANWLLSFSKMTLPHTLMRVVLMEQIYRAARIHAGHVYHK
ncbi:23S rRNA (pseudouridine(1915)-N(3))-methyltransferase RlmH [Peptoniphilus sp. EMRHCC_23]|uniref:23S rRNA (pseudouridine(1915)-N(3))-methyltransferase RlmH n=1 Tax=Peptoniphilus rachelemmaiella TaxID=2811779 RepID=UPI001C00646E|nr:23S rRNA (pseudouridine(1915)-N(3))-methyltransferase RlmH [Peptoniphilus rachelemmaiella]